LHSLDLLLDDRLATSSSESIAAAYRAVALHCVIDALSVSEDNGSFRAFVDGLFSRVAYLERLGPAILAAEPLRELRMEIEPAAGSGLVRASLLQRERDTRQEALDATRVYLKSATEELGPPFLELTADIVVRNGIELGGPSGEAFTEMGEKDEDSGIRSGVAESTFGLSDAVLDHGVKEEDDIDREQDAAMQLGKPSDKFDALLTPEVEKVANALKSSCTDLYQVVVDPLQDAIMQADEILKSRLVEMTNGMEQQEIQHQVGARRLVSAVEKGAKENSADETMEQSRKNDSPDVDGTTEQIHAGINRTGICNTHWVPKQSLMDWNPTVHTYEWGEDSIESSSLVPSEKVCLPSPKRRKVSPLIKMEEKKFARRRKVKRWSLQEDTLRKAVEKHGKGNWKIILNCYSDIFEEGTEVDLKDKWRNMTRH
ncbi:unnamed protein product, partial [Musa textilis]